MIRCLSEASAFYCTFLERVAIENDHLKTGKISDGRAAPARPPQTPEDPGDRDTDLRCDELKPTVVEVRAALDRENRRLAVKLRCKIEDCSVKDLYLDAFAALAQKIATKRTAFNRWQAGRHDTPAWADKLLRARLLK
jgi:hypothetical protein